MFFSACSTTVFFAYNQSCYWLPPMPLPWQSLHFPQTNTSHFVRKHILYIIAKRIYLLFLIVIPRYKKRLESDGLTMKSFRWALSICSNVILETSFWWQLDGFLLLFLRLRGLGINVPGAYRKLVAFPAELNWNYVKDANACEGDSADCHFESGEGSGLSENGSKRLRLNADSCSGDEEEQSFRFISKVKEHSTMAQRIDSNCCNDVELSFRLRPSCYATSCIRELLKS